jgi:hypothetical protein
MHGSSFTWFQHMAVWGNVVLFYLVNLLLSLVQHSGMYTIMFRLCSQPAYWLSLLVGTPSETQTCLVFFNGNTPNILSDL